MITPIRLATDRNNFQEALYLAKGLGVQRGNAGRNGSALAVAGVNKIDYSPGLGVERIGDKLSPPL